MSNVKRVDFRGKLPYDCDNHAEMCWVLGKLNAPRSGITITFGPSSFEKPNEHGGKTTIYDFTISGSEAVSTKFLERVLRAVYLCGGRVERATCYDIEANQQIILDYKKLPQPNPKAIDEIADFEDVATLIGRMGPKMAGMEARVLLPTGDYSHIVAIVRDIDADNNDLPPYFLVGSDYARQLSAL